MVQYKMRVEIQGQQAQNRLGTSNTIRESASTAYAGGVQDSVVDRSGTNVSRMYTSINEAPLANSMAPVVQPLSEPQSAFDEYDALYKQYEQAKVERDER